MKLTEHNPEQTFTLKEPVSLPSGGKTTFTVLADTVYKIEEVLNDFVVAKGVVQINDRKIESSFCLDDREV